MATTTRQALREYLIDTYHLGMRGVNTGTSASAITDDGTFGGQGAIERITPGCYVMITSGTRDGEIVRLSSRPRRTTGVMDLDPALTGTLANGDTYEVLFPGIVYDAGEGYSLHQMINKAIATIPWERREVPLTLINDGDMLASGTGAWTVSGAETLAKTAAGFTAPFRYLSVTGTGTGQYVQSASNYIVEQDTGYYYEVAAAKASANDTSVALRDITNGTALTLGESTVDEREPMLLINNVTMASTTEQVAPRINKADGSHTTAILWVILRKNSQREFIIQDRPARIRRLGELRATTEDAWARRSWLTMAPVGASLRQIDTGLWQYNVHASLAGYSLWYEEYVVPASLTSDTGTTTIPQEDLAPVVVELLLRPLRTRRAWTEDYDNAARDAAVVRAKYRQLHTRVDARERDLTPSWV